MLLLYRLFIYTYVAAIHLVAPFNAKARQWVQGRHNWAARLREALAAHRGRPLLWMHCASLGEFEQGRPLLEALRQRQPDLFVLLTFYSPSGYEIRKDYPGADYVSYLPADTPRNARRFLDTADPTLVIFVKYEFWYYLLHEAQQRGIPLLLVSALFRSDQIFFQPLGAPFRRLLRGFTHLFVQNRSSAELLNRIGIPHYSIAGDTRIDRVLQIAETAPDFPRVAAFTKNRPCLIAGSTWPPDEDLLRPLLHQHLPETWTCIIAPHQIDERHLAEIEERLEVPFIRYSQLKKEEAGKYRVLLIDNIGMLSGLYRYGKIAYIGGGFGAGIHNTLEPIAFGLPVFFGPRYQKFDEAVELVSSGGAFPVKNEEELIRRFKNLQDPAAYARTSRAASRYVKKNQGATKRIMQYLEESEIFPRPPE